MAVFTGVTGMVKVGAAPGTQVLEIESWELTTERNLIKASVLGDTWTKAKAGIGSWSGKFDGRFDPTDTTGQKVLNDALFGTAVTVTLRLQIDTSNYIEGSAWIKSVDVKDQAEGLCEATFSFEGDGTPTLTHG